MLGCEVKLPESELNNSERLLLPEFATIKSGFLSSFKSAIAKDSGLLPTEISVLEKFKLLAGIFLPITTHPI